ncbi:hypothetical protein CS022_24675 [Veronia nyctiphanis]|uniref:Uncharacterized protein n=1 Tax=Veronia nyctiphanis TaxID=1278244 RepID=A0A4Q0YAQ5_9GAMM|nr:hypothetical protein [Veronia nyctiphanis]RXJ65901.1 hypothetical protein CS022_24675 [Veronia nyctiphanis]
MKAFFKFSTIVFLLVILIGLVLILSVRHSMFSGKGASLTFVNSSGQNLQSAHISVAGQSCSVKQLGVGGEIKCHFENLHDSSYSVTVTLQGGVAYTEPSLGYVTGGMNFNDTITINQSGAIELVSGPIK